MSEIKNQIDGLTYADSLSKLDEEALTVHNTSGTIFKKDKFVESLLGMRSPDENILTRDYSKWGSNSLLEADIRQKPVYADIVKFSAWKNILNISARLINYYDNVVILECLLDKEHSIYEEWEFEKADFDGYDLSVGNLFYLRYFRRNNEKRLEIHNDSGMVHNEDFPKLNFVELFENSGLFKK